MSLIWKFVLIISKCFSILLGLLRFCHKISLALQKTIYAQYFVESLWVVRITISTNGIDSILFTKYLRYTTNYLQVAHIRYFVAIMVSRHIDHYRNITSWSSLGWRIISHQYQLVLNFEPMANHNCRSLPKKVMTSGYKFSISTDISHLIDRCLEY